MRRTAFSLGAASLVAASLALATAWPAAAMPGDELHAALRWLGAHPYLGPARLGAVEGLGPVLVMDAWQAGRALPGGGSVRLYLDVAEPYPAPPVKHEWTQNRVKREILLIEEGPPLDARPPVREILGRVYSPAIAQDYDAASPIPLGPDDIASGTVIGSLDTGPLVFEYGQLRRGGRFDYLEAWYRGEVGPIRRGVRGAEMRRSLVIVTPPTGITTPGPVSGTLPGQPSWSHTAPCSLASWSWQPAPGSRPPSSSASARRS